MPQCIQKLVKDIFADCSATPAAGIEAVVYLINRSDIDSYTIDSDGVDTLCTNLTLKAGTPAPHVYKLFGYKRNLSYSSEINVGEDVPDTWTHSLNFQNYQFDSESIMNLDQAGDVVAIVERKGKKEGDGSFLILGLENGLYKSADSTNSNDNNGARVLTMSSLDGAGESHSAIVFAKFSGSPAVADYTATKAYLESLYAAE